MRVQALRRLATGLSIPASVLDVAVGNVNTPVSKIPEGYDWPRPDDTTTGWRYWLTEEPDSGATQRYMVIADGRGEQHIVAERCYLSWGLAVVDALRAAAPNGYHRENPP